MIDRWRQNADVKPRLGLGLGLATTLMMMALSVLGTGPLMRVEGILFDLQFKIRGERPAGHEIVLVVIDDHSLREVGRWPWSRDKQAQLVAAIGADGARVIGMDIIYAEPEFMDLQREFHKKTRARANTPRSRSRAFREIANTQPALGKTDHQFMESLQTAKNVVLAVPFVVLETRPYKSEPVHQTVVAQSIHRSAFMLIRHAGDGEALQPYQAVDVIPPLEPFADKAASLGHVYSIPDTDGITRNEYLALQYQGAYYPSFGLEVARVYLGIPRDRVSLMPGDGVQLDTLLIPGDQRSRMLINYAGREGSFQYVSATDVLHKRVPSGTFSGKAVLVGTTALGTYDQKATPFSANVPGVEKHATVVENILHRQFLEKNVWSGPLELIIVFLCGLTLTYVLEKHGGITGTVLAASVFLGYPSIAHYYFVKGICIPVLMPLLTIVSTFIVLIGLNLLKPKRAKEAIGCDLDSKSPYQGRDDHEQDSNCDLHSNILRP